jgi:thiol-disulfide isomerase/thioredoxin
MRSLVLLAALASSLLAGNSSLKVKAGDVAPRFMLAKLEDDRQRIPLAQYVDSARCAKLKACRPVVLAFWSTSCIPCRKELPRLQAWSDAHPQAIFWPVLVDATTESSSGIQWLDQIKVTTKGLKDPYQTVGSRYGVCVGNLCNVPALVAIGADGKVKFAHQGYSDTAALEMHLNKALGF